MIAEHLLSIYLFVWTTSLTQTLKGSKAPTPHFLSKQLLVEKRAYTKLNEPADKTFILYSVPVQKRDVQEPREIDGQESEVRAQLSQIIVSKQLQSWSMGRTCRKALFHLTLFPANAWQSDTASETLSSTLLDA